MGVRDALRRHGYELLGDSSARFVIGRPSRELLPVVSAAGEELVAKVYPDERGEMAFRNMELLWASPFGERRDPPGLPRPVRHLVDANIVLMERVDGPTLLELGEPTDDQLFQAAALLADLHRSGVEPGRNRSARKLVLSSWRKVERVKELAPRFGPDLQRVVEALEASDPKEVELVASHGDLSPRNVLAGRTRTVLIDWERLQLADPVRDLAFFGTWSWFHGLRVGADDWTTLERMLLAYRRHRPACDPAPRLAFHVAVSLVRLAAACVQHWSEDVHLVPRLAAEAVRRLG